jgi:phosphate transport system permease protein
MTDLAAHALTDHTVHTSDAARRRLARRYAAERRFKALGLAAVLTAMGALALLLFTVVVQAIPAFSFYYATIPVELSGESIDREDFSASNFDGLVNDAVDAALPFVEGRTARRAARGLMSDGAGLILRDAVLDDPTLVGGTAEVPLPVSDTADLYLKGMAAKKEALPVSGAAKPSGASDEITLAVHPDVLTLIRQAAPINAEPGPDGAIRLGGDAPSHLLYLNGGVVRVTGVTGDTLQGEVYAPLQSATPAEAGRWRLVRVSPEGARQISDREIVYADRLVEAGFVERHFNWIFFTRGASREPEMAGVLGAVVGSVLTLMVTLLLAFPLGVAAAIYLEEFAPKNRWTDLIEVNINNLAAVPSIVFGLLGLAVFLNFFGFPRSVPLVGGMVLALITLPTIIIASRAALKSVPPSIREAALGVGASRLQTVFHHVLPLSMPGIMTGAIIGMAHALGETAPLLMIGMVAFIVDVPNGFLSPATILPVQIFMWADFPETAFQQRTSAAIIVLLGFLVLMNAAAVLLRKRFERRW